MELDLKTTLIILGVIFGSGASSSVLTLFGVARPQVEQAIEKQSFAQDQLSQCLERLEECHQQCNK
jgi:uncharacterized membrane protein